MDVKSFFLKEGFTRYRNTCNLIMKDYFFYENVMEKYFFDKPHIKKENVENDD